MPIPSLDRYREDWYATNEGQVRHYEFKAVHGEISIYSFRTSIGETYHVSLNDLNIPGEYKIELDYNNSHNPKSILQKPSTQEYVMATYLAILKDHISMNHYVQSFDYTFRLKGVPPQDQAFFFQWMKDNSGWKVKKYNDGNVEMSPK